MTNQCQDRDRDRDIFERPLNSKYSSARERYMGPISIEGRFPGYSNYVDIAQSGKYARVYLNGVLQDNVWYANPLKGILYAYAWQNGKPTLTEFRGVVEIYLETYSA